ncbi:MAG TPA: hypothetical protein VFC13_14125 [Actinomycetes bacterium]|nr:hypothetical protein [Actinomycetes bacterium]
MARNLARVEFTTFLEMATHLDGWAADRLTDSAPWEDVLVGSQAWLDYSARNQVLLASYGAEGAVAGAETWRLVPSTTEGRGCAVRAGERGYPVRVPVTTGGSEPDPYLGGHRPTRATVSRWEWRPVFSVGQLARRPAPNALVPTEVPSSLAGPAGEGEFLAAVHKVAAATVRGRLPKSDDPHRVLAETAGRLRRSSRRPELDPVSRAQVAWLVADRVGRAATDRPPGFDPGGLGARERWERLQDVLEPARKLTAALGVTIGTDLVASPLPRMEVVDDRVVPAGRRHRLPAASLEQLPIGRWVTVGPYTPAEWAARGEQASGNGAYLRLNKTAYLVAVDKGERAGWRLEDVAARTGHGLLAVGTTASLGQARTDAVAAVRDRYPALTATDTELGRPLVVSPGGAAAGWEQMPGAGRSPAELWHLDDQITLYVLAGPGGRWLPAIHTSSNGVLERLPLQASINEARATAEVAGHRAQRTAQVADPARADTAVAGFADSGHYSRPELAALIGHRLEPPDQGRVHTADSAELVELLGAAGFSPATTVAVLAAEQVDATQVATLLPTVGVPMADAIRVLHDRWDLPRTAAAGLLGATAGEMRDAGCTPVEIMASRPRDVLRTLPDDPHLWELAAGTMATAGHPTPTIARHLVAHAPTVDAFAAGLTVVAEPSDGLVVAARCQAHPDQLAAASEGYGLSPVETASILTGVTDPTVVLDTLAGRCDGDTDSVVAVATQAGLGCADLDTWRNPTPSAAVTPIRTGTDMDTSALLASLPPAGPSIETDPVRLLDAVTAGIEPTLQPTP